MKFGIRAKIFAAALPALVLPPLWVAYQSSVRELGLVWDAGREASYSTVASLRERVERRLARLDHEVRQVAASPSIRDLHNFLELGLPEEARQHRERLVETVARARRQADWYRGVCVLDAEGQVLALDGEVPPSLLSRLPPRGQHGDSLRWVVCEGPAEGRAVGAGLPLVDRWGEGLGWVLVSLDLAGLRAGLAPPSQASWILLYDHERRPVFPAPDDPGAGSTALLDELAKATAEPVSLRLGGREDYELFGAAPTEQGWALGLLISRAGIERSAARIQWEILRMVLASLAGAALLAALLARGIGERIRALAARAEAVGRGEYQGAIPVDGDDELGDLARKFNEMSARVQVSQAALQGQILELRETRGQLVRAEKLSAIGTLASGIAHELNSPLMAIGATASTVRLHLGRGAPDPEKLERLATAISQEVERAGEITRALVAYSRSGQVDQEARPVDLAEVIERAQVLVRARGDSQRITVDLDPTPPVRGDSTRLSQVVVNLLMNALDACAESAEGGEVRVGLRPGAMPADAAQAQASQASSPFTLATIRAPGTPGQAAVVLSVEDTGAGMSERERERMFDPFFTTKPAGSGTGLGLSITLGIVLSHGGMLDVESEPGRGTKVCVYLPVDDGEQEAGPDPAGR